MSLTEPWEGLDPVSHQLYTHWIAFLSYGILPRFSSLCDFGIHYRAIGWVDTAMVVVVLCSFFAVSHMSVGVSYFFSFDFSFFLSLSGCFVFLTLPRVMSVWSSAKGENGTGCLRIPENIPSWLRTKMYWTPRRPDDVKMLVMVWILWHHWGPWSEPQV